MADTPASLDIFGRPSGPIATVTYIVRDLPTGKWALVDPTYDFQSTLAEALKDLPAPSMIWLTHGHFDHTAGLAEACGRWQHSAVLATAETAEQCKNAELSGAALFGFPFTPCAATRLLADGEQLELGESRWTVIAAPGHCPGEVLFYSPQDGGCLLAGDVLFAGSVGRWDLPGANYDALSRTIRDRVMTLPPETRVYPGHGPGTTIGHELETNWIVQRMMAGERVD